VELTPRPAPLAPARRRNLGAMAVLVVVLVALGFIVFEGLSNATLYFYNADEAVQRQADLGTKRFRIQGTVQPGSREPTPDGVTFFIVFDRVPVEVHHVGDPPELFKEGIPVVLEGRWSDDGRYFASDRIMVKHSSDYVAKNSERLTEAEQGGTSTTVAP
jgi:cytochrome c-type biogenesis protein CcmE